MAAKDFKKQKRNPFLAKKMKRKDEVMKAVLRKELLAEIRKNGPMRDEVRGLLDGLPPWTPFEDVTSQLSSPLARSMGITDPLVLVKVQELTRSGTAETRTFQNSRYIVHRTPTGGGGFRLSIRTLQNDARHDWREYQRIKNELCGEDREAVELYPREDRLVDTSNQFFLHVLPADTVVPVGFEERMVIKPRPAGDSSGTNQRPWEAGSEPADAVDVQGNALEKLVYERAVEALQKERASDRGEEDAEPEGDRQLHDPGDVRQRGELHRGQPGEPGEQPGE